ncbi:hypothetical protein HHI36_000480 [Cryptolaemus montrouzieri]|uniref:Uncharacterized protein n=1 Tax=Cryptolaemus montrouzieri TaxID=559131 RepID=A0ABD2P573_9CUCU
MSVEVTILASFSWLFVRQEHWGQEKDIQYVGRVTTWLRSRKHKHGRRDLKRREKRYERLKADPEKHVEMKQKSKEKYLKTKEKMVKDMSPREQRVARKIWREKTRKRRCKLAQRKELTNLIQALHFTPPCSEDEGASHPEPNRRIASAREMSTIQRKRRNHLIRKQEKQIIRLKGENRRLKKKLQQLKKSPIKSPNSKVDYLLSDNGKNVGEIKKTLKLVKL